MTSTPSCARPAASSTSRACRKRSPFRTLRRAVYHSALALVSGLISAFSLQQPSHAQIPTADDFNPIIGSVVSCLIEQPDRRILVAGDLCSPSRLTSDGMLDPTFKPQETATVSSMVLQTDGSILLGGDFESFAERIVDRIARLNPDGTLDAAFYAGADGPVYSLVLQPDGKILVAGDFATLCEQPRANIGRLNPDGTLDFSFDAKANGRIQAMALQTDGKILVGGNFSVLGEQPRAFIGRLNADGTVDPVFHPDAGDKVNCIALQADGKILLGGEFITLSGESRDRVARLFPDGTLDETFRPEANGSVSSLMSQADGKILLGGHFYLLNGKQRHRIGRLNPDGSLDVGFDAMAESWYACLALQADGKMLVGGQDLFRLSGKLRFGVGRLNSTGPALQTIGRNDSTITWLRGGTSPEFWKTTFEHSPNGVDWIALGQGTRGADGWQLTGVSVPAESTIRARGYTTGGHCNASSWFVEHYDGPPSWTLQPASQTNDPGSSARFSGMAGGTPPISYQWFKDGQPLENSILITGANETDLLLGSVQPLSSGTLYLVASNALGVSTSHVASLEVRNLAIAIGPGSQKLLIGGNTTLDVWASGVMPFTYQWWKDGNPLPGQTARSLVITNMEVADAGAYRVVVSNESGSVTSRIAWLSMDILDYAFNPGGDGNASFLSAVALQTDGKILMGGHFTTLGQAARNHIGRLNPDGTLDKTFDPGADGPVSSMAVQHDGKIMVGGNFTMLGGKVSTNIGRLNLDGTADNKFNAWANGLVNLVALEAGGTILVSGDFTELAGKPCEGIGRLQVDGTPDSEFKPGVNGSIYFLALQPDGRIVVGGDFTTLGGQSRQSLGRLNRDGTADISFNAAVKGHVYSLALQPDGKILVGGQFTMLAGQPRNNIGRLNADGTLDLSFDPGVRGRVWSLAIQADGKILVGGNFLTLAGEDCYNLARLHADGAFDGRFNSEAQYWVTSMPVQPDGKILVGGIEMLGGQKRDLIGRLHNTEPATQSLSYNGSKVYWARGGTSPEVWQTTFEISTNGVDWVDIGPGTRASGGWESPEVLLPLRGTVRARGHLGDGYSSTWFLESLMSIGSPAGIPLLSVESALGPSIRFKVTGGTNAQHFIETSTNFMPSGANEWQPVTTLTLTNGSAIFDWTNAGETHRFFRAR